jgi:hypothetical protein
MTITVDRTSALANSYRIGIVSKERLFSPAATSCLPGHRRMT